jgi:hypothetical protein
MARKNRREFRCGVCPEVAEEPLPGGTLDFFFKELSTDLCLWTALKGGWTLNSEFPKSSCLCLVVFPDRPDPPLFLVRLKILFIYFKNSLQLEISGRQYNRNEE